jgi:hypothetical protein
MLEFRYCEDPMEARRAEVVAGRKNTIWNSSGVIQKAHGSNRGRSS